MGKSKDLATGASYVDVTGDTMTGALTGTSAGFVGDVNIGNNDSSNPVSKLRLGATLYGAADIVPVSTGHKIGLDFKTDSTGDTTIDPVTRMSISNEGYVTTPFQPAFKASIQTQSATRTTTNTETVTPYDTTQLNIGNHYNTSNYRFTAPVAGNYFFSLTQNKVGKLIIYIRKNGSNFHAGEFLQDTGGAWEHCTISCVIPLAATDYVEASFKLVNNSSTQYAWNGGSALWDSFSGFLIG